MRLLKAQNTNLRNIYGKGVKYDVDDQVIVDSTNSMLVPKGTGDATETAGTALNQRPVTPVNGHVRYNTSLDGDGVEIGLEVYNLNAWRRLRYKEPNVNPGIVWQNLGNGDATETVFGLLDSDDPDYPIPTAAEHVLVLVENVVQLPTTNYTLEQSVSGNLTGPNSPYADGWYIKFTSAVDLGKPVTVVHNFDK